MKKIAFILTLCMALPVLAGMKEGLSYYDNQQYSQAFKEFKPLADRGNEQAQYYVAYLYINGFGVDRDEARGLEYLKKSADQEFEKAMSLLGYYLSEGIYMPQNKKKGHELYQEAAEKDDDDALINMGVAYYLGDGERQDTQKALEYFQKVNLVNKPIVGRYIGDIYQASKDSEQRAKAKEYYRLAAANGDMGSFHALAYALQQEHTNMDLAVKLYTYAASQSHAPSQYALGTLYANGEGVAKNVLTAYAWLSLAANQNLSVAIQAQKQLEENMTLSDVEKARREMIEIQRNTIGKIESPLKDTGTMKDTSMPHRPNHGRRKGKSRRR